MKGFIYIYMIYNTFWYDKTGARVVIAITLGVNSMNKIHEIGTGMDIFGIKGSSFVQKIHREFKPNSNKEYKQFIIKDKQSGLKLNRKRGYFFLYQIDWNSLIDVFFERLIKEIEKHQKSVSKKNSKQKDIMKQNIKVIKKSWIKKQIIAINQNMFLQKVYSDTSDYISEWENHEEIYEGIFDSCLKNIRSILQSEHSLQFKAWFERELIEFFWKLTLSGMLRQDSNIDDKLSLDYILKEFLLGIAQNVRTSQKNFSFKENVDIIGDFIMFCVQYSSIQSTKSEVKPLLKEDKYNYKFIKEVK